MTKGKIKLGYLENHAMSLLVYLLNKSDSDFEEKPFQVKLKKPLRRQIKKQLSKLNKGELEYSYLITSLDSILKWKKELLKGVSLKFCFVITPEYPSYITPEHVRYGEELKGIQYSKDVMIQFLREEQLSLKNPEIFRSFIGSLINPPIMSPFDGFIAQLYFQKEEARKPLEDIYDYHVKKQTKLSKDTAFKDVLERLNKGDNSFGCASYLFRNSIDYIFKPAVRKSLEDFIDTTRKVFSKELKTWAEKYALTLD